MGRVGFRVRTKLTRMLFLKHVVHHSEPNFKIQFMNSYSVGIFIIRNFYFHIIYLHSKNCWAVLTQLWVKYGETQPFG